MDFDTFTLNFISEYIPLEKRKQCQDYQLHLQQQGKNITLAQIFVEQQLITSQQGQIIYSKYKAYQEEQKKASSTANAPITSNFKKNIRQKLQIGTMFNQYRVDSELGQGGMGAVFKVFDTKLSRYVALKVILKNDDPNLVQRFMMEAKALASLKHNNVIHIFEIGEEPRNYFTMEYIDGKTLHEHIQKGRLKEKKIANFFLQIAKALHEVHGLKIIHRDLKPANIMIDKNGTPKIMDFGLVKVTDSSASQSGNFIGTPTYASPEQAEEKNIDIRSDIYSLGATLYEALTKRKMFEGENFINVLYQVINKDPISPRVLNPDISIDIEAICLKCLEKKSHRRYANALLLAEDLENLLLNRPIKAKPPTFLSHSLKWLQRNKVIAITIASFISVILFVFIFFTMKLANKQHELQQKENLLVTKNEQVLNKEVALEKEKVKSREGFYPYVVALSDVYIEKNNINLAHKLLQSQEYCPDYLREWEWYWLTTKCHQEVFDKKYTYSILKIMNMSKGGMAILRKYLIKIYADSIANEIASFETRAKSFTLSNDENELIAVEEDKIIIWNIKTQEKIKEITVREPLTNIDMNFSNNILAVSYEEGILFFSYPEMKIIYTLEEKDENIKVCSFHPKQNLIVYAGKYDKVYTFNLDKRKSYPAWSHPGSLYVAKFSPSGDYVVSGGDNHEIRIWDVKREKLLHILESTKIIGPHKQILLSGHTSTIYDCSFSQDEQELVSVGKDNSVKLWDIKQKKLKANFRGHTDSVYSCIFSSDKKYIWSGGDDSRLKKWDIVNFIPKRAKLLSAVKHFAINDHETLIATAEQNHTVTLWDMQSWEAKHKFFSYTRPLFFKFGTLKNKEKLFIGDNRGNIKIYDTSSQKIEKELAISTEPISHIDAHENKLLLSIGKSVAIYDIEKSKIIWSLEHQYGVPCSIFSNDKQIIAVANKKNFTIYNSNYEKMQTIEIPSATSIKCMTFSQQTNIIAIGTLNHLIYIFDVESGQQKAILKGHDKSILSVDFNKKGNRLISSSEDCTIRVWNVQKESLLVTLNEHTGYVAKSKFIQNDTAIMSVGEDNSLILWSYQK